MRPTLRTSILRVATLAVLTASCLAVPASSGAITLYDGNYSTDLSSSTPTGLSPASGSSLPYPASNLRLSWHQVPGADQYQVQLARQSSSSASCSAATAFQLDNVVLTTTTTQNEWVPTLATEADGSAIWTGTYCWRVRTTGKGPGAWSEGFKFTRTWASAISGLKFYNDHDGQIPRNTTDPDYATGSTTTRNAGYLTWNALPGAAKYEVQVSPSQSFSEHSIIVSRKGVSGNEALLLHLPDDTYYWRVRGISPNGTEGAWSTGDNSFTVKWRDPSWSDPSRLYPADSSVQSEFRIGWTPMPGASHYEYQVGTNGGCFWDPTVPNSAPHTYGDWVKGGAKYDDNENLLFTQPPLSSQCRISPIGATTINNWTTLKDMVDDEVWDNVANTCLDESGKVICERAHFPDTTPDDMPASPWRGASMGAGDEDGEAYEIFWRVRPVYMLDQTSESGWKVEGTHKIYGSWTKYRQGGLNREQKFGLDLGTAPWATIGARCENGVINPNGLGCLEHVGASMQADEALGAGDSATMQVPVMTWKPFSGAGGYIVQIARDPLFNNMERTVYVPAEKSRGFGFQQSYIPTDGIVDNAEGTGMWWRVVPCLSDYRDVDYKELSNCSPLYSDDASGLPTSVEPDDGYADMGVAQTFKKRTQIQSSVHLGFSGATPLIRWTRAGVSATDYPGWSQGIPGSHHYEVQLARDPFMTKDAFTIKTTIPRVAPFKPGDTDGTSSELPDGIWYYRIRPVDRNDILGTWTSVESFNKRVSAPSTTTSGGGAVEGAGVVVSWNAVQGADNYQIQWSQDSGFESGIVSGVTHQTVFRIPDTTVGTFYWRVRAVVEGVEGQWTSGTNSVKIVPATTLRYALNRNLTQAADKVTVTGQLKVAGVAANGKTVRLQRKGAGCDAASGQYIDVAQGTTGRNTDDGLISFPAKVTQNTCFRLAWVADNATKYSAPIPVKVVPGLFAKLDRKRMVRGKSFCVVLRSNVALSGRVRVQYRIGKRAWQTTKSGVLRNVKTSKQCAAISKAGTYQVRVLVEKLNHRSGGWKQYEDTSKALGTVKVIDVWKRLR